MFKRTLGAALLAALLASTAAKATPTPPSATDFGRLAAIDSLTMSPDGKHIAGLITTDGVTAFIAVWNTDAMDQKPYIINPIKMSHFQFSRVLFIKNDRLYVTFKEMGYDPDGNGSKTQAYYYHSVLISPTKEGPPVSELMINGQSGVLVSSMPKDPKHFLVHGFDGSYYKVDAISGMPEIVHHSTDRYAYIFDSDGVGRARTGFFDDKDGPYQAVDALDRKTGKWSSAFEWHVRTGNETRFAGFDEGDGVLGTANESHEKQVITAYDPDTGKPPEVAFEHPLFDATGAVRSHRAADAGRILGFTYAADTQRTYWTDGEFEDLEKNLRKAMGVTTDRIDWIDPGTGKHAKIDVMHGFDVSIVDYSSDLSRVIVEKSGPSQPPEYYLLKDKTQLILLGKAYPQIDLASLGETRLVEIPARDGLIIPAFVTTPPKAVFGPGPYPVIVTPHGGPWARDYMEWDETGWTQYFASRGYVVIQPQFRGSRGWGAKLWHAGDAQWGLKMQDDIEDSAKWLVAQGIGDAQHMAIHGYSYGGYAAFDAAVRANGLYRCAIAGAGVAEIARIREELSESVVGREYQLATIDGVSPLAHVKAVNIPVLAYHGDSDHNVSRTESQRFTDALKTANLPYKFVELPNMDHTIDTWTPQNWRDILLTVDDFLKTSCQMGGR